jgi:hypothetical protein
MTATNWNIRFDETHPKSLTLEVSEEGKVLGQSVMSATDVEGLMNILAGFRLKMMPAVGHEIPRNHPPSGPANPIYAVVDVPVLPGKLLMIRHEGFGWLSFLLPQKEAEKMAHGLLEQPTLPPKTSTMYKN